MRLRSPLGHAAFFWKHIALSKPPWTRPHHRSIFADMSLRVDDATLSDAAAAIADVEEKSELLVDAAAALTLHEHYDTTGVAVVPVSPLFTCIWHV
jgi:hypothetical protein